MKIFIYKTIFVLISIYVLYEFTIGYQIRNYGTSNQGILHATYHWDGGQSYQSAETEIVIEEYLPIP